jgi:MraZ protein
MQEDGQEAITFKPLLGMDEANLDKKGRLLLSAKKRARLGSDFVIGLGECGCLVAYPKEVFDKICLKIMSYDAMNEGRQQYTRLTTTLVEDEINCDSEGRFVVPNKLREKAGLKDSVLILGLVDRLEIWAADEYERFNADPEHYQGRQRELIREAYDKMTNRPS